GVGGQGGHADVDQQAEQHLGGQRKRGPPGQSEQDRGAQQVGGGHRAGQGGIAGLAPEHALERAEHGQRQERRLQQPVQRQQVRLAAHRAVLGGCRDGGAGSGGVRAL